MACAASASPANSTEAHANDAILAPAVPATASAAVAGIPAVQAATPPAAQAAASPDTQAAGPPANSNDAHANDAAASPQVAAASIIDHVDVPVNGATVGPISVDTAATPAVTRRRGFGSFGGVEVNAGAATITANTAPSAENGDASTNTVLSR